MLFENLRIQSFEPRITRIGTNGSKILSCLLLIRADSRDSRFRTLWHLRFEKIEVPSLRLRFQVADLSSSSELYEDKSVKPRLDNKNHGMHGMHG